jgi:hypothetical protein
MTTSRSDKGWKHAAGAAGTAGSFAGGVMGGIIPNLNVTVNNNGKRGAKGPGAAHGGFSLPAPEFTSPAQVRTYCNSVRAVMVGASFELSMAAEILSAVLATVPDPDGSIAAGRIRARRVSRRLQKSASAARNAAKHAASTYALFEREYSTEMDRVKHRATKPHAPRMDWGQQ